jgi:Lon protease-like protein
MEDFQCPLCMKLLLSPVSIVCGHTFCRKCIQKSYEKSPKCPICRISINISRSIPTTYMIQSYIEANFGEELQKRKAEEVEEAPQIDPTILPIVFTTDSIFFPGTIITLSIYQARYLNIVTDVMSHDKKIGLLSSVKGQWIGLMVEVLSSHYTDTGALVVGICKERLRLDYITPQIDPATRINVTQIDTEILNDEQVWVTKRVFIKDTYEPPDIELETQMMDFTNQCISTLARTEIDLINKIYSRNMIPSFFMLSVLKCKEDLILKSFFSTSNSERLAIVKELINLKKPSRFHIKIAKENNILGKYRLIIIILALVFIYYSRSN